MKKNPDQKACREALRFMDSEQGSQPGYDAGDDEDDDEDDDDKDSVAASASSGRLADAMSTGGASADESSQRAPPSPCPLLDLFEETDSQMQDMPETNGSDSGQLVPTSLEHEASQKTPNLDSSVLLNEDETLQLAIAASKTEPRSESLTYEESMEAAVQLSLRPTDISSSQKTAENPSTPKTSKTKAEISSAPKQSIGQAMARLQELQAKKAKILEVQTKINLRAQVMARLKELSSMKQSIENLGFCKSHTFSS